MAAPVAQITVQAKLDIEWSREAGTATTVSNSEKNKV